MKNFIATIGLILSCNAYGILIVDNEPSTVMKDKFSELNRAEGVAFSPSGEYIATANLFSNMVTFYKRTYDHGSIYETSPSFSINGPDSHLEHPHDISFSPDGRHLAVANRKGNSITIYAKNMGNDSYKNAPIAILRGNASKLSAPSSVRYCPVNNIMAVANTGDHSITFYRYKGDFYDQTPYQTIRDTSALSSLNSLDFSRDGELLAIAVSDSHSVLIYQRSSHARNLYQTQPIQTIQGPDTNLCYPHSVSFHPTNNYLVVSNAQGRKNINVFKKTSDDFPFYSFKSVLTLEITQMYEESTLHLLEQLHKKGGCKGVSFSPDGTSLAITQNLTADGQEVPFSVSMLLLYPIFLE